MSALDHAAIAAELRRSGITHVVWIPDTELGGLDAHLGPPMQVIRPCREGEAVAIAAGLLLGGARPVVICQCTGFFEAGDALRNVVKDLGLPLFLLIGHRSRDACAAGTGRDSAARYLEPLLAAWELPYEVLETGGNPEVIGRVCRRTCDESLAAAVVIAE
jgi:sulfopyruvate decarboxylase TPP-binding subunit